ncbi:MAG: 3-oxo-tetronate 4-phosphate decarboxylase [Pseudomonadota bacterium]
MTEEHRLRDEIAAISKSFYDRGLTHGTTGNISARLSSGDLLMTPTGSSLGALDPARISKLSPTGQHVDGDPPTKESFLHAIMYERRADAGAVVHLHSPYAVAVSCRSDLNPADCMPPLTAYYVMRVGVLPVAPYYPPGDKALADAVGALAADHHAVLLANHGPVVAGQTLRSATDAAEELEETAKLFLMLEGKPLQLLTPDDVATLRARFG